MQRGFCKNQQIFTKSELVSLIKEYFRRKYSLEKYSHRNIFPSLRALLEFPTGNSKSASKLRARERREDWPKGPILQANGLGTHWVPKIGPLGPNLLGKWHILCHLPKGQIGAAQGIGWPAAGRTIETGKGYTLPSFNGAVG